MDGNRGAPLGSVSSSCLLDRGGAEDDRAVESACGGRVRFVELVLAAVVLFPTAGGGVDVV